MLIEPPSLGRIVRLNGPFEPRILVTQHPTFRARYYDELISWTAEHVPEFRKLFLLKNLPLNDAPWGSVVLHASWLQDPVQGWSAETYAHERWVGGLCDRMGIPVVNRVERLTNAGKLVGARLMEAAGLNVPRSVLIRDRAAFARDLLGLRAPLMVREEWGHWGEIARVETEDEARAIDLSKFKSPLATEIVDVRDPRDGLYRKYRCLVAGRRCVSHHLQVSEGWITRGDKRILNDQTREEELGYIASPDQHSELFLKAARAMGLEFVAFDYGYAPDRSMIVWEANPLPHIRLGKTETTYRNAAIHRSYSAMLGMYLDLAGLPISERSRHALESAGNGD